MVTGVSPYSLFKFTYLCITKEERSCFVINSSSSVQGLQVLLKFLHSILLGNCNLECAVLTYVCSYTGQWLPTTATYWSMEHYKKKTLNLECPNIKNLFVLAGPVVVCLSSNKVLNSKVVTTHTLKAHRGTRPIAPFLTLALDGSEWSTSHPGHFTLDTHWIEAHCALGPVWMVLENRKSFSPTGIWTPDHTACS